MIYTTLNRIRAQEPCAKGWQKLLAYLGKTKADDEPLAMLTILESNGLDDALWCFRAEPQHPRIWRMYAVRCARRVQSLMTDPRSIKALDVAEKHAQGLASDDELQAARDAARDARNAAWAARNAAEAAAWAAVGDAWAAAEAARDAGAAWDAARDAQAEDFRALLAAHEAGPGECCALERWFDVADAAKAEGER